MPERGDLPGTRAGTEDGDGNGCGDGDGGARCGIMQIPLFKKLPFEKVCHIPARAPNPGLMALSPPHRRHGMGPGASTPRPPPRVNRGSVLRGNGAADPPRSVGVLLVGSPGSVSLPLPGPLDPPRRLYRRPSITGVPRSSRVPRAKPVSGGASRGSSLKSNSSSKRRYLIK